MEKIDQVIGKLDGVEANSISDQEYKLQVQAHGAFVGYARYDLLGEIEHEFGTINDRPLNPRAVNGLLQNFGMNGIVRCNKDTAIRVSFPSDIIKADKLSPSLDSGKLTDYPNLADCLKTLPKKIYPLGGQHRHAAMSAFKNYAGNQMLQLDAKICSGIL